MCVSVSLQNYILSAQIGVSIMYTQEACLEPLTQKCEVN